jgi:hypothetical protein
MEVIVFENQTIYAVERVETIEHFVALCREYIPQGRPIEIDSGDRFVSCADASGCHKPMLLVLVGVADPTSCVNLLSCLAEGRYK